MKHLLFSFLAILLSLNLSGCTMQSGPSSLPLIPTEQVSTSIAQTVQARLSPLPQYGDISPEQSTQTAAAETDASSLSTSTPAPTLTQAAPSSTPTRFMTSTPTPRPTSTPSPTPTLDFNSPAIQIQKPGPMSKVVSPLTVGAYVRPGANGRVQIELLGEDGRLIVRKVDVYDPAVKWVFVSEQLDFDVSGVAEAGRLQIITLDSYGRLMAQDSVDLILMSMGESDVNPPGLQTIAAIIQEPSANKMIQGGTLTVSGLTRIPSDEPLLVQLVASNGAVAGYRQVEPVQASPGGYGPFTVEISYQVTTATWVRLIFQASSSGRIPGIVYATSLEVLLSP